MILHYTEEYLANQMARDKVKLDDIESIKDWFTKTPLGNQMELVGISKDGYYIKIEVKTHDGI